MEAKVLTIGRLASATGTNVETIRFYEKSGVLPSPSRTDGNYRSYDPDHLNRVSFIRRARDLGFSLDQVKALSDCQTTNPSRALPSTTSQSITARKSSARSRTSTF